MNSDDRSKEISDSIDNEINNAISTISELEEWVKKFSNDNGMVRIEQKSPIKAKFSKLHKEVQLLTQELIELGILTEDDLLE
jgi:hypothetical protein